MVLKFNARVVGIALAALLGFGSAFGAILMLRGKDPATAAKTQALLQSSKAGATAASQQGTGSLITAEASRAVASLSGPLSPGPGKRANGQDYKLAFDVARLSPGEPSVLAGRAAPGQIVDVLADGVVIGSATADENGNWVLVVDRWLASPDAKLELRPGVARLAEARPAGQETMVDRSPTQLTSTRAAAGRPTAVAAANAEMMQRLDSLITEARRSRTGSGSTVDKLIEAAGASPAVPAKGNTPTRLAAVDSEPKAVGSAVVPVPIQFRFQEADFTPYGRQAAQKLLEYLKVSGQSAVSLSGHADDRGTESYNMDLSRKRLETVQAFLRAGGYDGSLKLMPMGKSEPYRGVDRSRLSTEELYQVDRRVELRIQN
jgi:outer membrane protein OmpA-like peptidoglycan-associated protein